MKKIIILATIAVFLWAIIFPGWIKNYSDGERTGDVYKFSKKGIFVKSWEGEMYLGGYHSTGGKTPTIETDKFSFSIPVSEENDKKDLIEKIKECTQKRSGCTIEYKQWFKGPVSQDSGYTVTGVNLK